MCANCFIELVRRRVDEVSGLPNAFEIAHKNGLKPKLITRCLIPEGFIDGIDVVSCSEFNSLEDDISKISGSSDTSQLWIYDSACESSKSNDRNKHIFEISEYMEDIVSQLPQSSSSQTEMIQKKDKKTKRLKAKTLTVNKKIASIDTDGSTNP